MPTVTILTIMRNLILYLLMVFVFSNVSHAEERFRYFLEGSYYRLSPDGVVEYSRSGRHGSEIDLNSTFGFEPANMFAFKTGVIFQRHQFFFNYKASHFSSEVPLNAAIHFGELDFAAHFSTSPSVEFQTLGLFYGYRLIDNNVISLSLCPGIQMIDYEVELSQDVFGIALYSERYAQTYVIPVVLAAGELQLYPKVSLTTEFSGSWHHEQSGYVIQPLLNFSVYSNVTVFFGYSHTWFKDTADDNVFEVTLAGPVLGLQIIW